MQLLYRDETLRGENGSKRTKLGQTMLKDNSFSGILRTQNTNVF